jgi:hypothetical protein
MQSLRTMLAGILDGLPGTLYLADGAGQPPWPLLPPPWPPPLALPWGLTQAGVGVGVASPPLASPAPHPDSNPDLNPNRLAGMLLVASAPGLPGLPVGEVGDRYVREAHAHISR